MSAAAFRGVALFIWSRNRRSFAIYAGIYALIFLSLVISGPHSFRGLTLTPLALLLPLILPLSLFLDSGRIANLDLTDPDGSFPRNFFVLPAAAYQIVLPFMLYGVLFAAAQWILAAVIIDRRVLDLAVRSVWLPILAMSFVAWMQALMWTPARHRSVRGLQLIALLSVYAFVLVNALYGKWPRELTIALSLMQLPIAYGVAVHGVAKCRRGEPGPRVAKDRDGSAQTSGIRLKRGLPDLASPLDAQVWMEHRMRRWTGKSAFAALIPAVLLILVSAARLSGLGQRDPESLEILGTVAICLLFTSLGVTGIITGFNFCSFRTQVQWYQTDAYRMSPFFAALPFTTGEFAWAKMRAATQRMLWLSAGVLLVCVAIAEISGFSDAWLTRHASWRAEHGFVATLVLAALPPLSFLMLMLSATASVMCVGLFGRSKAIVPAIILISVLLQIVIGLAIHPADSVASLLAVIIPIAAAVKVCGLAALIFYVGTRDFLSWRRLAVLTGFWAITAATVRAFLLAYAPPDLISPMTALCIGIVVAPVLGAVAAPVALSRNRAR